MDVSSNENMPEDGESLKLNETPPEKEPVEIDIDSITTKDQLHYRINENPPIHLTIFFAFQVKF